MGRARAEIDLAALRANVRSLRERAPGAEFMAVVKADAYGHGMIPCARAAREAGATWIGTATPEEALAVRAAGIGGRVLCWLWTPGGPWREGIEADLDMSVSGMWALDEVVDAARGLGRAARIQLKADTGLGRNGCLPGDWPELVRAAVAPERDGRDDLTGRWSHYACSDEPGHPSIAAQLERFREMVSFAEGAGVRPEVRHIANSPGSLSVPESDFVLVRPGIALYGICRSPEIGW
ncbi:alanine racemase, partial [Streptomyces sp. NPDC126514]|uniref:alanine racemase n=1 Tax=Streptomyces sp. NPDC126514 TaxID=3155210 RepID=UPI00333446A3